MLTAWPCQAIWISVISRRTIPASSPDGSAERNARPAATAGSGATVRRPSAALPDRYQRVGAATSRRNRRRRGSLSSSSSVDTDAASARAWSKVRPGGSACEICMSRIPACRHTGSSATRHGAGSGAACSPYARVEARAPATAAAISPETSGPRPAGPEAQIRGRSQPRSASRAASVGAAAAGGWSQIVSGSSRSGITRQVLGIRVRPDPERR